ncbi:MAG: hypothetical protein NT088_01445 [Candidatus Omnitrophica bacterium]|nr:hypothetical protein [Candidatus Omnitrophota bacterium]
MGKRVVFLFLATIAVLCIFNPAIFSAPEDNPVETKTIDTEKYPNKGLVQAAWDSYNAKNYDAALLYAERSIATYDNKAKQLQASLKGPIPVEKTHQYWPLNDVATAKFIKARILWLRKDEPGAKQVLSDIINNYSYAVAYDARGWFWSVSNASRDMLKAMELGIDFGDSSSSYLTFKAWEAYTKKDYKSCFGYAKQCVEMYKAAALWQQKSLSHYPKKEDIKKYWALNMPAAGIPTVGIGRWPKP